MSYKYIIISLFNFAPHLFLFHVAILFLNAEHIVPILELLW